jgi:hypothetical protein
MAIFSNATFTPDPLIYDKNAPYTRKNIVFIDNKLTDLDNVLTSINNNTYYIVYSNTSSINELRTLLQNFSKIDRISFMFRLNRRKPDEKVFIENKSFGDNVTIQFIEEIIRLYGVTNVDFLACNTLQHNYWKNIYTKLHRHTGVIVGASNNETGNIKYGGDWVMENTKENVEAIYFTPNIGYYQYVLDVPSDIQYFRIDYTHDTIPVNIYILLSIDVANWSGNGFYNLPEYYPEISSPDNYNYIPSWFVDCFIYINDTLAYTTSDISRFTLFSDTNYPMGDPNDLTSFLTYTPFPPSDPGDPNYGFGFAVWTKDNNIYDNLWWNFMSVASLGITDDSIYISNISFASPMSSTCFPANTLVLTDSGYVPIQKIDTKRHTIRQNKINAITKSILTSSYMVCIEKDSIAENMPNKKTIISPQHEVLYKGKMRKARDLLGIDGIYKQRYNGNIVYNVLLEKHSKMVVHGMIVETLHPTNYIAMYHNGSIPENRKLITFNELNNYYIQKIKPTCKHN